MKQHTQTTSPQADAMKGGIFREETPVVGAKPQHSLMQETRLDLKR